MKVLGGHVSGKKIDQRQTHKKLKSTHPTGGGNGHSHHGDCHEKKCSRERKIIQIGSDHTPKLHSDGKPYGSRKNDGPSQGPSLLKGAKTLCEGYKEAPNFHRDSAHPLPAAQHQ